MRNSAILCVLTYFLSMGGAAAGAGGSLAPPDSWDKMQQFEYNIGRLAGGLDICRRYALSDKLEDISKLSPYGQRGYKAVGAYDGIRGGACGRMAESAEQVLGDKSEIMDYLKAKYDCGSGRCVER